MKRTVELNPNEPLGHYHSSKHCKHSGSQNDGADRLRSVRLYKSTLYFSMDLLYMIINQIHDNKGQI